MIQYKILNDNKFSSNSLVHYKIGKNKAFRKEEMILSQRQILSLQTYTKDILLMTKKKIYEPQPVNHQVLARIFAKFKSNQIKQAWETTVEPHVV